MTTRKIVNLGLGVLLISILVVLFQQKTSAEQSGGSPNNNPTTSRLKTISDALTTLTYGSTAAGAWGDWGAMWNRIYSAGIFSPDGDLTVGEVSPGKTFYSGTNSRTQKTGTGTIYSTQSLETKDDYLGTYKDEESTWTEVSGSPFATTGTGLSTGKVKKDERTGLWWSAASTLGTYTNSFDNATDGTRPTGGNAIAFCNTLQTTPAGGFAGKTTWYLPTQKELMQAYIDGIYSQDTAFGTTSYFWSSTEGSNDSTNAWRVRLYNGSTLNDLKTNSNGVRCVRRD